MSKPSIRSREEGKGDSVASSRGQILFPPPFSPSREKREKVGRVLSILCRKGRRENRPTKKNATFFFSLIVKYLPRSGPYIRDPIKIGCVAVLLAVDDGGVEQVATEVPHDPVVIVKPGE